MKKRLISILLSLCMVLTLLPATVLSAGVGTSKAGECYVHAQRVKRLLRGRTHWRTWKHTSNRC